MEKIAKGIFGWAILLAFIAVAGVVIFWPFLFAVFVVIKLW